MIDTCQANTLYKKFYSPNILSIGSSAFAENSYSHHADSDVGVAIIDRFTYYTLEFMEHITRDSNATILDLFENYNPSKLGSNPKWRHDQFPRQLNQVLITEFFGSVPHVELTSSSYKLERGNTTLHSKNLGAHDSTTKGPAEAPNKNVTERNDISPYQNELDMFNFDFVSKGVTFVVMLLGLYYVYK